MKLAIGPFAALGRYVSREFATTFALLTKEHRWARVERAALPPRAGALPTLLSLQFRCVPKVVLFWESYPDVVRHAKSLADAGSRVYVMTDDLHHRRAGMEEALRLAHGVLSTYAPRLGFFFPAVDPSRVTWVPHAASPDFLVPMERAPQPVVFVSGAMNRAYPLRLAMRELALRRPELARLHDHPGYGCAFDHERDGRVGRGYAAAMQECLAAFTDALRHRYLVAKHFEIPATGALLVAEREVAPQLETLGFVDGVHYVSAAADDLEEVVERVLNCRNREEIDAIRRRGHALVHERHTTVQRAAQIDAVCI